MTCALNLNQEEVTVVEFYLRNFCLCLLSKVDMKILFSLPLISIIKFHCEVERKLTILYPPF